MRWRDARSSTNVTNRGGMGGIGAIGGGAGLIIALIAMVLGINPGDIMNQGGDPTQQQANAPIDTLGTQFVEHILGDTEDTWHDIFAKMGKQYVEPKLNIFNGRIQSACGLASEAMGPFYCSANQEIYIDLAFYDDLRNKFGAPGDVAEAYVIAHEVGHHVQQLLGISDQVANTRQGASQTTANRLSVRMELQADCFAGVWLYNADKVRHLIDAGEVQEALDAASAIGDDRLQQEAQGRVSPESFTHGTSAQRSQWFNRGYTGGDMRQCNTFDAGAM